MSTWKPNNPGSKMRLLLISNMYPSPLHQSYGIFVKNFENATILGGVGVRKAVIMGRGRNPLEKATKYAGFFRDVYRELFRNDYDLIYVHYISHSLLPIIPLLPFIRKPIVVNAHGDDILPDGFISKIVFKLTRKAVKASTMIVVPSHFFKSIAFEKYGHRNIYVSPSGGVDHDIFNPGLSDKPAGKAIRIGYVSRIEKGKGWDAFLKLLHRVKTANPEIHFEGIIANTGADLDEMTAMISSLDLGDRVVYLGLQDQRELAGVFRGLDLLIFPTLLKESLGLVGLEAMACGVPVIGSDMGGLNDYIVDGQNGYIFQPGNVQNLYEKFLQYHCLAGDVKKAMRQKAIEKAGQFESVRISSELIEKLHSLV